MIGKQAGQLGLHRLLDLACRQSPSSLIGLAALLDQRLGDIVAIANIALPRMDLAEAVAILVMEEAGQEMQIGRVR